MDIKIIYDSWDKISISRWRQIKDIISDEARDEMSKEIGLLSVLCDVDENTLWDMNIMDLDPLTKKMGFIEDFDFPKDVKYRKINIGNTKCNIEKDLQKFTIAQFVDYQSLYKNFEKNIGAILACFIVPEGHRYGDGYDVAEFAKEIEEHLSIVQSNSICFFLLRNWLSSLEGIVIYSNWIMRRMAKKNPNNPKIKEMKEKLEALSTFGWL